MKDENFKRDLAIFLLGVLWAVVVIFVSTPTSSPKPPQVVVLDRDQFISIIAGFNNTSDALRETNRIAKEKNEGNR